MCEIRLAQVESEDGSGIEVDNEALFEPLREKQPLLYQVLCKASRFRRSSFLFTGRANRGTRICFKHYTWFLGDS